MKNNLYNLIGGGGRMIIFLITIPLLIKFMGLEKYGLWIILTSIGNVALLLDAGLIGTSMFFVSKTISNDSQNINKVISSLVLINIIIIVSINLIFLFFSDLIIDIFFSDYIFESNLRVSLILVGVYSSILISHNLFIGIIQSHDNFLTVNIIKFCFLLALNVGLVFLSYFRCSFFTLTIWMVFCCFITLISYIILTFKFINLKNINWEYNKAYFKDVSIYSLNTWLGYAGNVLFGQMDKIILGLISTPYIVGAYAAIISITTYINSLATVGLQPIMPKISKLYSQFETRKKEIYSYFNFTLQFNTVLVFCLGLAMIPFLEIIVYRIMDIEKTELNLPFYFFIAIVFYSLNSLYVPGFYFLMSIKESKIVGRVQLFSSLFALLMIYLLGLKFGLLGAIIGNLGFLISHYFNFKMSKILKSNIWDWIIVIISYLSVYFILCIFIVLSFESFYLKLFISSTGIIFFFFFFVKTNISLFKQTFLNK